jgi:hypothetical protein
MGRVGTRAARRMRVLNHPRRGRRRSTSEAWAVVARRRVVRRMVVDLGGTRILVQVIKPK